MLIRSLVLVVLVLVCFVPVPAGAGGSTIGVFFDEGGNLPLGDPPLFTIDNQFYVVGSSIQDEQIAGFEFDLLIDPTILTFGTPTIRLPGTPINVGDGPNEFIVGLGTCAPAAGPTVLVEYQYGVFTPGAADLTICMIAATPSSFVPSVPGYLGCDSNLHPFGVQSFCNSYGDGCAVVYSSGCWVLVQQSSWGSVKARF